MVLPEFDFNKFYLSLPNPNTCVCGSDDIAIIESQTLGVQTRTIIKCNKCGREIKRRTYKRAEKAWNKNNPQKGSKM